MNKSQASGSKPSTSQAHLMYPDVVAVAKPVMLQSTKSNQNNNTQSMNSSTNATSATPTQPRNGSSLRENGKSIINSSKQAKRELKTSHAN